MRRQLKRVLVIGGTALLAISLARPLVGFHWEETKRKGLDLLIAVDTSKSMLAQDVKPNRLARAKMAVEDLVGKLDGDRVGLIAFAGSAFLQCPLTLDYDAFRQSLESLDTAIIPRGGTDIAAAIHEAEAALENSGSNDRLLVLITDGEDLEGNALDAARAAAGNGLKVFTVGVGTANGELIPVPDEAKGTQFVKDASGQFAKSRLDESKLKEIADAAGGIYQPLGQQFQGLEALYRDGLAKFTRHDIASRMRQVRIERFQWPLALGLLCLSLEPLIGIRRRRTTARISTVSRAGTSSPRIQPRLAKRVQSAGVAACVLALLAGPSFVHGSIRAAEKAYGDGQFEKAAEDYGKAAQKDPRNPELQFNHGTAAYKAGQHETASDAFGKVGGTDNLPLREDNFYNLGNTQYRLGQKTEQSKPDDTIKNWEQAIQSYESALQLKADDADARYNRDLVRKKLEELKKRQGQQKQNQQNQDQQQKQQDPKDQQDQKSSDAGQNNTDQKNSGEDSKDQQQLQQSGSSGNQDEKSSDASKNQESKGDDKSGQSNSGKQDKPRNAESKDQKHNQKSDEDQQNQSAKPPAKNENRQDTPSKSGPDRKGHKVERANGTSNGKHHERNGEEHDDELTSPGKMSRREAKELLDSLKDGDRKMPTSSESRGGESRKEDEPLKDW
jgi:Ca-activated chloride channel family protein